MVSIFGVFLIIRMHLLWVRYDFELDFCRYFRNQIHESMHGIIVRNIKIWMNFFI